MSDKIVQELTILFDDNLIPYMEILKSNDKNIDATIKVYFPKIMLNICKFVDKNFIIENKKSIFIKKDKDGYSFVELSFFMANMKTTIRLHSILQNTWGITNEY
ncbi:MAG: hypothetical protein RBR65_08910 [Aliarcobacter sp.]|jgi:hypothetical protein|nr:hypothetical protein [Aliarcobacter sp.]